MIEPHSKLHKLIEICAARSKPATDMLSVATKNAQIFHCGTISDLPKWTKNINGIVRPPYGDTILEFAGEGFALSHTILFIGDAHTCTWLPPKQEADPTRSFYLAIAQERTDRSWRMKLPVFVVCNETSIEIYPNEQGNYGNSTTPGISELQLFSDWARCAAHVFQILRCVNLETKDNHPPLALNKKRIASGKVPIYSFKTLHLRVPNYRHDRQDSGGTHASPRIHLRRGHIRTLADGRTVWVQPCVVGSKHGTIHKNYRLRPTDPNRPTA